MGVKCSHPGDYIDLHRLMEAVLKLRLRVDSLETALLGPHCGLNIMSSKTNANGRRTRNAGLTRTAREMPYIAQPIPRGRDG
jgi:hypothetical protein